jgi:hypothetical protein
MVKRGIRSAELADEKSGVRAFGAAGWGAMSAVIAGLTGAIVGGALGGKDKRVVFVTEFNGEKIAR